MIFDTMAVKTRVAVLAVMQIAQCHLTQRAARKLYTAVLERPWAVRQLYLGLHTLL